jgi:type IV secretion system protein VirB3
MSRLSSDPVFQGLTRPTMVLGVSYMYFVANASICLVTFINMQSFFVLLVVAPAIHTLGYLICLKEPRAMEMLLVRMKKGNKCINKRFHGGVNSYDLY